LQRFVILDLKRGYRDLLTYTYLHVSMYM